MGFLVTDDTGVWKISHGPEDGRKLFEGFSAPCQPCASGPLAAFCCQQSRECYCFRGMDGTLLSRMPAVPGVCGMLFSPCQRYLYQLSSEADCIHTRISATGELVYAAPAGVFPRMMTLDRRGRSMLCAGGTIGECYIFSLPELAVERVIHTPHPCFAVDEWKDGLVLLCASEGEAIHTVVYTLGRRALRVRTLAELPGLPGSLCVCEDERHAMISTQDGLMKMCLQTGSVEWNRPELALSMRIDCRADGVLVSDSLDGKVRLISAVRPWMEKVLFSGRSTQACFF